MTTLAPRDETLVLLMLDCGLRVAEAVSLPWSCLDPSGPWLTVLRGKGGRDRVVPVALHTWRRLQALRQPGPWLCPSSLDPARHIMPRRARVVVGRLGSLVGIHLHPHMLRHTYAVTLLRAGVPLVDISMALGHSDLATTAIYLRVEPAEAGARIRAALAPATQLELVMDAQIGASPQAAGSPGHLPSRTRVGGHR